MPAFFKKHNLFTLYLFVLLCLYFGMGVHSGQLYFNTLHLYTFSFTATYFLGWTIHKKYPKINVTIPLNPKWLKIIDNLVPYFLFAFVILHYIILQRIPLFAAWQRTD